jgi:HlyD family secretion protein
MTRARWLRVLGGLAIGTVALVWLLRPERLEVETVPVTTGPLMETVGDEGITRVRDRYLVTAPVAGRVERIALRPGDAVTPGKVLARLRPPALDARGLEQAGASLRAAMERQSEAESMLAQARVGHARARRDRERAEPLVSDGGVARAEVERLGFEEESRLREVRAAEFHARAAAQDVATARAAMSGAAGGESGRAVELRSPVGGTVLTVPEQSARTVEAGTVLLEVGDPASLEIVVDLLSTDAVRVAPGDEMLVTRWGGGDTVLCGAVRRVEPSAFTKVSALGVEEQRVNVLGDLDAPPRRLGDRFRVEVQVVLWQADNVLQVPASALFRRGEEWAVFVVAGGRARERVVRVGHASAGAAEVLEGVEAGVTVIRHPTDRVKDGVRVRAPK